MSLAHLALGSRNVEATAEFLCQTMGWQQIDLPSNVSLEVVWIDISLQRDRSQQLHIIHVTDFTTGLYEREFGRHVAVFHNGRDMEALKRRLKDCGGTLIEPIRPTPFDRFFFREPINGYVFEVINEDQWIIEG